MTISKDEFIDWTNHAITKEVMGALKRKYDVTVQRLIDSAGENAQHDNYHRGLLVGLGDCLGISFYDLEEVND